MDNTLGNGDIVYENDTVWNPISGECVVKYFNGILVAATSDSYGFWTLSTCWPVGSRIITPAHGS